MYLNKLLCTKYKKLSLSFFKLNSYDALQLLLSILPKECLVQFPIRNTHNDMRS